MEFSVLERGLMLNVLPKEGNLFTMRIVHELRMALGFSDAELQALNVRPTPDGRGSMWDDAVPPKEVEVGAKAREIILEGLQELDRGKKLTEDFIVLCDRFGYEGQKE